MKNSYICECNHFDFSKKDFKYWEDKNETSDEITIINYILNEINLSKLNILHIGVGNSQIYKKLTNKVKSIDGITISNKELKLGNSFKDINYRVKFCDKMSKEFKDIFHNKRFDLIIDNNLKSYSCCQKSFNFMFENITKMLTEKGIIITSINGMNWFKSLKPKLSFNFKYFFHYKLKEVKGNPNNIFSIEEARIMSNKHSLNLLVKNKIVLFEKKL
tara:strand:- start:88 stop:738 length:651 start_codon:yes stop_codon:yes gene_type:complete